MKPHKAPSIARTIQGNTNVVTTQSNQPMGLEYNQ